INALQGAIWTFADVGEGVFFTTHFWTRFGADSVGDSSRVCGGFAPQICTPFSVDVQWPFSGS
ncbi:hypothetical protein, partial [Lampropedia hyalina]|uniref:hypothetical protein n=1 Tax=Lampropedia hyalina TaxID=198706 RepID=UPI001F2CDEA6